MRVLGSKSLSIFPEQAAADLDFPPHFHGVSVIEVRSLNVLRCQEHHKDTLIRPSGTFSRKREKGKPRDSSPLAPASTTHANVLVGGRMFRQ
jgi:hypothetical protein